jgi:glycosyltransferase involved in cell wall biosynthesis
VPSPEIGVTKQLDDRRAFPRVLLINHHVFNKYSGGGIALTNYFEGWPRERIAAIYGEDGEPDRRVCDTFFRLTNRELGFPRAFAPLETRRLWRPLSTGHTDDVSTGAGAPALAHISHALRGALGVALRRARSLISVDGLTTRVDLTPALDRFIREFSPEVIFGTLGNLGYLRLTDQVAKRYRVPLAIQMADDWPSVLYREGIAAPYLRKRMSVELSSLLQRAAVRLAISDAMAEAYRRRYGVEFMTVTPPVDSLEWGAVGHREWSARTPFQVVYMGTIVEKAQLASLRDVCDAVDAVYRQGRPIELRVYTPAPYVQRYAPQLERPPAVTVLPAPSNRDAAGVLGAADLLVVPVNFDNESIRYVRYSMPGKVPAYMATGTPILVYGPPDVAAVQYARTHGWGHVVSRQDPAELQSAIAALAGSEMMRSSLARRAQSIARERHDTQVVRRAVQGALSQAAGGSVPPLP